MSDSTTPPSDGASWPSTALTLLPRTTPFHAPAPIFATDDSRSILEILDEVVPHWRLLSVRVEIAGEPIPEAWWPYCRPKLGATVNITCFPRGGGGGARSFIMLAVSAAALFLSPALAGPLAAATGLSVGVARSLIAIGLSLTGLLISALIPVKQPEEEEDESFGISKFRNDIQPWGTPPYVVGKLRVFPKKAAQAVVENHGTYQVLREFFDFGPGPLVLTDFKIGDTGIDQYADAQVSWTESYDTGNNGRDTVWVDAIDGTPSRSHYFGDNFTEEVGVELVAPNYNDSPAPDGTFDFRDLPVNDGNPNINPSAVYSNNDGPFGWVIRQDVAGGLTRADDLIFNFVLPQGLYQTTKEGQVEAHQVAIRLMVVNADENHPDYRYVYFDQTEQITHTWQATYYWQIRLPMSIVAPQGFAGPFDVYVTRSTPKGDRQVDTIQWTDFRVLDFAPKWYKDGHTMVTVRIKATGQLNGQLDRFNCLASRLVATEANDWSLARSDLIESSSPHLNALHMLRTAPGARRIDDARIDFDAFWAAHQTLAARQEVWRQRPCNYSFDTNRSLREAVDDVLRVARARLVLPDGRYSVVVDEDTSALPPVQVLSSRTMRDVQRQVDFIDLPHAMRVRFFDESLDWAEDELIVLRDGYTLDTAVDYESLETKGVVYREQAWLAGAEALTEGELRRERVTGIHSVAHMSYRVGDVVAFRHRTIARSHQAARIVAVDTTAGTITLDTPADMEVGESYRVRWATVRGDPAVVDVSDAYAIATDATRPITITLSGEPAWWPEVGDQLVLGLAATEDHRMKVLSIEPRTDMSARVTLVPEANAIHDWVTSTPPSLDSVRQRGDRNWPPPVRNLEWSAHIYTIQSEETYQDDAGADPGAGNAVTTPVTLTRTVLAYTLSWLPPDGRDYDYRYSVYGKYIADPQAALNPINNQPTNWQPPNPRDDITDQYDVYMERVRQTSIEVRDVPMGTEIQFWVTTLGDFGETPLGLAATVKTRSRGLQGESLNRYADFSFENFTWDSSEWTFDSGWRVETDPQFLDDPGA